MDNLSQSIITLDVHFADEKDRLRHAWDIVHAKLVEGQKPTTNTGSQKLLNSLQSSLSLVKNGMSSEEIHRVRGVIADAIDQLRAGA